MSDTTGARAAAAAAGNTTHLVLNGNVTAICHVHTAPDVPDSTPRCCPCWWGSCHDAAAARHCCSCCCWGRSGSAGSKAEGHWTGQGLPSNVCLYIPRDAARRECRGSIEGEDERTCKHFCRCHDVTCPWQGFAWGRIYLAPDDQIDQ